jgi:acetyl esterase/lipase
MKRMLSVYFCILIVIGCDSSNARKSDPPKSLTESRRGFVSKLAPSEFENYPVEPPPESLFQMVQYDSPIGKLSAYLSTDPKDGKKHPAILWIHGGDCNSIGNLWYEAPPENDQTASAFREAGIIMMYPSLRGGNENPGVREGFLGEVDDILSAASFLAKQKYVDPNRIYLGGHSTGGTLVLLVAESGGRFRAVFSFGPVSVVAGYDRKYLPFNTFNDQENELRSPGVWLHCIDVPTFVLEGTEQNSNIDSLQEMAHFSQNSKIHFHPVPNATHFSILRPVTRLIAGKILQDDGPTCNITLSEQEIDRSFGQ